MARSIGIYRKCDLPNYGVFDERRYFEPGTEPALIEVDGALIGLTVCEDIWHPGFPEAEEAAAGALLVVNSSASPYHRGKGRPRESMVAERARSNGAAFALCNSVGGQDELVFDGGSVVVRARRRDPRQGGAVRARAAALRPASPGGRRTLSRRSGSGSSPDGAAQRPVPVLARLESGAHPEGRLEPRLADPIDGEEGEVYAALARRPARLRLQERLRARRPRPLRRDRLRARRTGRCRRPRSGPGQRAS